MNDITSISINPKVMSGTPVFAGTRVLIKNMFDYLKGGHDFEEFLVDFPDVSLEQAKGVLELAQQLLLARITSK
ncbi:MAG TPA: DUF433 domain-containing protein [Chloroflexia bacterium]|nr:DUF433 domain-containing protein [Chloroflexia bacterium]